MTDTQGISNGISQRVESTDSIGELKDSRSKNGMIDHPRTSSDVNSVILEPSLGRARSHSYSPNPGGRDWSIRREKKVKQRLERQYVVFSASVFTGT